MLTPYYEKDDITLYHGNCLDIIPQLCNVDLVLTDPPYGIGLDYDGYSDSQSELRYLLSNVMPKLIALSKRVVLTCGVSNMWMYPQPKWVLCWYSAAGTGRNPWGFTDWQPILVYGKDPYLEKGLGARSTVINIIEQSPKLDHPCPKPVVFWERLLRRVSIDTDDIVLDPFAGSGTTLRVAKDMNMRAIGIERSEKYCDAIVRRLSQNVFSFK